MYYVYTLQSLKSRILYYGYTTDLKERFEEVDIFGQDWATGEFVRDNPQDASFIVARCSKPIHNKADEEAVYTRRV